MSLQLAETTTCDISTGIGIGATITGVPCTHFPSMDKGRRADSGALQYTDIIEVAETVDIRDGCTRSANSNTLTYADAYAVHIPTEGGTVYAVVWVEYLDRGLETARKRVYLMRHAAAWPGP
jgi:hypothetical protein